MAPNLWITHLLFVDDILLFVNGSIEDCRALKLLMDLFLKATGLQINFQKSTITPSGLSVDEIGRVRRFLNFEVRSLQENFKYLGFLLKPDAYRIRDWKWLLAKVEKG